MAKLAAARNLIDFSRPWEFSDVVLLVEGHRFNVHRSILGIWSPVFSRMFTADFREKTARQVPLPGKKASEIKEMLLVIYPSSSNQINENNCLLLLDLAREYMMTKLTEKCEDHLMDSLEKPQPQSVGYYVLQQHSCGTVCLDLLEIAQCYGLKTLETACINKAKSISFRELKNHGIYEKIRLTNYRRIVEEKIIEMEQELSAKERDVQASESKFKRKVQRLDDASQEVKSRASNALKKFENVVTILEFVASKSSNHLYHSDSTDEKLKCITKSGGDLKSLHGPLSVLYNDLKSIMGHANDINFALQR